MNLTLALPVLNHPLELARLPLEVLLELLPVVLVPVELRDELSDVVVPYRWTHPGLASELASVPELRVPVLLAVEFLVSELLEPVPSLVALLLAVLL